MPVSLEDFLQHRLMGGQLAIIDEVRMKTNSQIKTYHELDQIERDTVESLFLATHSDVFAYLGRHRLAEGDEVVRVLIPGAVSVDIVNRRSGELIVPSEKLMNAVSLWPFCPMMRPITLCVSVTPKTLSQ